MHDPCFKLCKSQEIRRKIQNISWILFVFLGGFDTRSKLAPQILAARAGVPCWLPKSSNQHLPPLILEVERVETTPSLPPCSGSMGHDSRQLYRPFSLRKKSLFPDLLSHPKMLYPAFLAANIELSQAPPPDWWWTTERFLWRKTQ